MQAIILSRRDWREHDQIISLYTLEKGKVETLARGVKKILSKNAAALEPFCFVEAEIIPGKEINHLGAVSVLNVFKNIRGDLAKSLLAGYAMNLLDKIIHSGERDSRIFKLAMSWLEYLDGVKAVDEKAARRCLDVLVVKLFFFLGFDITKVKNLPPATKKELTKIIKEKWSEACYPQWREGSLSALHHLIYRYVVYHSEKKLADWAKLAKIGEI